jgi:hypothetical protein
MPILDTLDIINWASCARSHLNDYWAQHSAYEMTLTAAAPRAPPLSKRPGSQRSLAPLASTTRRLALVGSPQTGPG